MPKSSLSRFIIVLVIGIVCIVSIFYISLTEGLIDMSVSDILQTLLRIHVNPVDDLLIFEFRLPRIITAALVGIGLGIAGAVIQGISRNALADPGVIGINAGAGAAVMLFLLVFEGEWRNTSLLAIFAMPLFGLIGGAATSILLYLFAWKNGKLDSQRLLLVGIAVGTGFNGIATFLSLKMSAGDYEMARVWLSGSIANANWYYILSIIPWFIVLIPILYKKSRFVDLLQLDESSVKGLGVNSEKEKAVLLLSCIGLISACVSISGGIGFVGLIAPHIAKRLIGLQHNQVLPVSAIIGAVLVMSSDFIAKTIFTPSEIPVGVVVALIGVPYFVFLLTRSVKRV